MSTEPKFTEREIELLSAYLDGVLNQADLDALEARLRAEPELRAELETLRQIVTLIHQLPPISAPRSFALDASMARRPAPILRLLTSPALTALSAAAATLFIVLGAFLLMQSSAPRALPPVQEVAVQLTTESDQSGERLSLTDEQSAAELQQKTAETPTLKAGAAAETEDNAVLESEVTASPEILFAAPAEERRTATPALPPVPDGFLPAAPSTQGMPDALPQAALTGTMAASVQIIPDTTSMLAEPRQSQTDQAETMGGVAMADQATVPLTEPPGLGRSGTTALAYQPTATLGITPSLTLTPTNTTVLTITVAPTATITVTPSATSVRVENAQPSGSDLALLLLAAGVALLMVAGLTVLLRRR